ncbi:MAG: hypothetical protein ACKVJU_22675 [Verrucomicrobiales bacterium]
MTSALVENEQTSEAIETAKKALKSIAALKKTEPLEKPWTHAELEDLETWFLEIAK